MKRLAVIFLVILGFVLGYPTTREAIFSHAGISQDDFGFITDRLGFLEDLTSKLSLGGGTDEVRRWTLADGKEVDAVLVAADSESVQLRIVNLQGVYQAPLRLLSPDDRGWVDSLVSSKGKDGVWGFPLNLKTHPWPDEWSREESVSIMQVGTTNRWRSEHFEVTNTAGMKPEAIRALVRICESVDGVLNALPLPLPVNRRPTGGELQKIQIEHMPPSPGVSKLAAFWDEQTDIVHVYAGLLQESNLQFVTFDFSRPDSTEKYDMIVQEVTRQSTSALMHLNLPAWVPEGVAEYLAASQIAPASYQFLDNDVLLKCHINEALLGDRILKHRKMHLVNLETLMNRDLREWNTVLAAGTEAGRLQYDISLLLMDYFSHRDHPDGLHFRRYFECVLSGMAEAEARETHLLRGRSYAEIQRKLTAIWKPLGLTINFQSRGEFLAGDVTIDTAAEEVRASIVAMQARIEADE